LIEQPKRSGQDDARAFYGFCPTCSRLLSIEEGRWPDHHDGAQVCPSSGYPHVAIISAEPRRAA
jgi:hypothetical protein